MAEEAAASKAPVTVFGGTGFLGRRVVACLLADGLPVRVAARHPGRAREQQAPAGRWEPVEADLRDEESVAAALRGAGAAINAVGLYVERGDATFQAVHVEGAGRVARLAAVAGVRRLIHISGIGARADSPSSYVRSRAAGEAAVRDGFAAATIFRPSVLFGPDDAFLTLLARLVRLPVVPLFGRGNTRLQPVFVDDVAAAAARALATESGTAKLYELGGPQVYSYRQLLETVARAAGRRPVLLPVPFPLWDLGARALRVLPNPPLTSDQLALAREDNLVGSQALTLADLAVTPTAVEKVLPAVLSERTAPGATD